MIKKLRAQLYRLTDVPGSSVYNKIFSSTVLVLIVLSVISVIFETHEATYTRFTGLFTGFELIAVVFFSLEYILRVFDCVENPKYAGAVRGRLRYMASPMAIIDLLAVVPFYLPMLIPVNLLFLRTLRLLRLARLFKLSRYSEAFTLIRNVLARTWGELAVTFSVVGVLFIVSSCVMYIVENPVQPNMFSSIPAAMWWCVITLTTVGYGDMYPVTVIGRILAGLTAFLGIGMFAVPAGILGSGFVEEVKKKAHKATCPHCGKEL